MGKEIRLLIADDHPYVADGVSAALSKYENITIVGMVKQLALLKDAIFELKPDIILIDIMFGERQNGIEFLSDYLVTHPKSRFVVFTQFDDVSFIRKSYELGARAFISKSVEPSELHCALVAVQESESIYMTTEVSQILAKDRFKKKIINPKEALTRRQLEIMKLKAEGASVHDITGQLKIAQRTLKAELQDIREKLNVKKDTELAILAFYFRIVDPLHLYEGKNGGQL